MIEAQSQQSQTAIIHDIGYSFTLTAPTGWKYDMNAGRELGLPVVFYPDTSKWTTSPVVMYANVTFLNDSNQQNLEDVLRHDLDQFETRAYGEKVVRTKIKTLKTFTQGRKAELYEFIVKKNNNYETVAYIEEENVVVMIVVGSRKPEVYERFKPALEKLVLSYYWLGE